MEYDHVSSLIAKPNTKMRISNKILFFVILPLALVFGYVACVVIGKRTLHEDPQTAYILLWCLFIAPTIAAIIFTRIRLPLVGGMLTVPFSNIAIYFLCFQPRINIDFEPFSAGTFLFMFCVDAVIALLPAGLIHAVCCRLDSTSEEKLATRVKIGMCKAMQVMSVGVLCGIPVVFLLMPPKPIKLTGAIPSELIFSLALIGTIPLAGIIGVLTAMIYKGQKQASLVDDERKMDQTQGT